MSVGTCVGTGAALKPRSAAAAAANSAPLRVPRHSDGEIRSANPPIAASAVDRGAVEAETGWGLGGQRRLPHRVAAVHSREDVLRRSVERAFGRLKHEWAMLPLRVRGVEGVRLHVDLTMLATLASTLATARAAPLAA